MRDRRHTIANLAVRSHEIAQSKGWYGAVDDRPLYVVFLLNVSEVSEALEDWRANRRIDEREQTGSEHPKPCGIPIELADLVIRICQHAGSHGQAMKLAQAVATSRASYEKTHPFEEFLATLTTNLTYAFLEGLNCRDARLPRSDAEYIGFHANTIRRCSAFMATHGVDFWGAIDEKEAYNRMRPIRHGGKKC
jgi:hypothetical protein